MKKKILLSFMLACIGIFAVGVLSVSAGTYGDLTYQVSNGEVTITDCNTSATGDMIIPETIENYPVTRIGYEAFYGCSSLTSVNIPDSVTSIGSWAFWECSSLTNINIPDSVTSIDFNAFLGCSSLTGVYITDIAAWCNIRFYNDSSNPLYYAQNLYLNGELVTNLIIPDGVTSISSYAFYGCSNITSVTLPNGVTSIGEFAFNGCYNIESLYIADLAAYLNCRYGTNTSNPMYYAKKMYINGKRAIKVIIPEGVTQIPEYAFYNCSSLTDITIPDSVTSIGQRAFEYCSSLTSISLPNGITSIGRSTFYNCSRLTDITIPDSVTSIDEYAFYKCSSLTSINIPNSVTSIGESAFLGCSSITGVHITDITAWCNIKFWNMDSNPLLYANNLYLNGELVTDLVIPNSVQFIGNYLFQGCRGLTRISLPDSVTNIGENAFYNCRSLTSVTLGKSIAEIEMNAFSNCNISTVFYRGTESEWEELYIASGNDKLKQANIIFNAKEKTYHFVTGCDYVVQDITDYEVLAPPTVENGDKRLLGWYDNEALSGTPVTFPYYGDATTLYAAWTDRAGTGFDDAFLAETNREYTATTTEINQKVYYEFIPKLTGEYRFYSKGNIDTYATLCDSERQIITSDDDSGEGNNFKITYNLTAGEKYYIAAKRYSGVGTFTFVTETDCFVGTKTVCVTAAGGEKVFVSIPNYIPENAKIILACYDNGALAEVQSAPNKNETIYFVVSKAFDSAKVMVWETLDNMCPICDAEIVK